MTTLAMPSILVPNAETPYWHIVGASASGGASPLGNDQTIVSPAARWAVSLTIPVNSDAKLLAAQALLAALDGRANYLSIGPVPSMRMPWRLGLGDTPITPGRGNPSVPELDATLDFTLAADLALNAMQAQITRTKGGPLLDGMHFSIAGEMKQIILGGVSDSGPEGVTRTVSFRPWIRNAAGYASATAVEFAAPKATMQLAGNDSAQLQVDLARTGVLTLDLVEALG